MVIAPFCARYVKMVRLRDALGPVRLINARESDDPQVLRVIDAGFDLNDGMADGLTALASGMVLMWSTAMALMTTPAGVFNRVNALIFRSPTLTRFLYPILRFGRNATLKIDGSAPNFIRSMSAGLRAIEVNRLENEKLSHKRPGTKEAVRPNRPQHYRHSAPGG